MVLFICGRCVLDLFKVNKRIDKLLLLLLKILLPLVSHQPPAYEVTRKRRIATCHVLQYLNILWHHLLPHENQILPRPSPLDFLNLQLKASYSIKI